MDISIDPQLTLADKVVLRDLLADVAEHREKQEPVSTPDGSAQRSEANENGHVNGTNIGKQLGSSSYNQI